MSGANRRFELIGDEPQAAEVAPPADAARVQAQTQAAQRLLFTALKALSQRAMTAITNAFSLVLVGLVWLLTARVLDDPTENKLIGVGGFAVFCLCLDIIRRRTK